MIIGGGKRSVSYGVDNVIAVKGKLEILNVLGKLNCLLALESVENALALKENDLAVDRGLLIADDLSRGLDLLDLALGNEIDLVVVFNESGDAVVGNISVVVRNNSRDRGNNDNKTDKTDQSCVNVHLLVAELALKLFVTADRGVLGLAPSLCGKVLYLG